MYSKNMKIDVQNLLTGPVIVTLDHSPNYFDLKGADYQVKEKIQGTLHFSFLGNDVVMKGTLHTRVQMECIRCMDPMDIPIDKSFALTYMHKKKRERDDLNIIKEEEVNASYFDGFVIIPDMDIRELILFDLPDYPKCKENCMGLCPQCGGNLNKGPCQCRKTEKNPPQREKNWKDQLKQIHPS